MNVLYLAHRIPYPPNKGDKIRTYHTLRYLAARHDVWCACFVDDPADMRHVPALRALCREVIAIPLPRRRAKLRALMSLLIDESASEGFYRCPAMTAKLRELSRDVSFDAALFFSSSMGQYTDCVRARRFVMDFCDLDSRKWADLAQRTSPPRSWILRSEARLLAAREHELYDRFDASILISAAEANDWPVRDRGKLHIVGNGVELPAIAETRAYDSNVVGFVGDLRYSPNEDAVCWFAEQVWPKVHTANPQARFHVVGRGPSRAARRLDRQPGIRVIGEVPDVLPHWLSFQIAVAPLRIARGVQNKVLEAMAAALPVVATPQAAAGIDAEDGKHVCISADAVSTANRIGELLTDPDRCARLGAQARAWVTARCQWRAALNQLERILFDAPSATATVRKRNAQLVSA